MRKLGQFLTLWTALLFYPLSSFALGLGEIEVSSFLNQPLKAEIEVISARPGEVDDLLVSLASRDAFRKAGLERPSDLSKLRFKVEKSEDGQSATILITTKTPIKEPFLNFLVEADWAKGRLLREFTVLLDPPYFAQQAEPAAAPPTATAAAPSEPVDQAPMAEPDPVMTSEAEPVSEPIALADEPAPVEETIPYVEDSAFLQGEAVSDEIVVGKGDTLWAIASQFKDEEHSMAQVMLAMQALNPEAFGQDNINNLKVGAVLRAPDRDALDRFSKQEAYAQVLEQNGLWDEYVARVTGETTTGSPVADATGEMAVGDQAVEEGQLSLLTPDEGDSTSASLQTDANTQDAGQIRKQLALAEEELEAAKLENQDLKSRISDLEEQISKFEELQKLVQIEDDSLAQLQQDQATEESIPETVAEEDTMTGMVEEQPTDVMIEAAETLLSEEADGQEAEMAPAEETEAASDDEMMAESEAQPVADDSMVEESTEAMAEGMDETAATEAPEEQQEEATVPAPVIVTEAPESVMDGGVMDMLPSMDQLLSDPIMLGGIGAILALLIGFLFLKRKKSGDEEEGISVEEPGEALVDEDATPIHMPSEEDVAPVTEAIEEAVEEPLADTEQHMADTLAVEAEEEVAEVDEEEMNKTAVLSADELPSMEETPSEQDDVLNEVDVYLAYGLYDNAEELLKDSLENTPERADYRAKLLDTYFATKNVDGFVEEAEALKSLGSAADRFWSRVQIMGYELAPSNELFAEAKDSDISVEDLEYAKPDTADFDIGAEEDITDFSNTDFDLSEDADNFDLTDTQVVPPGIDDEKEEKIDHFSETQSLDDADLPDLDEVEDLPDEIGDFDLDLGGDAEVESEAESEEVLEDEDALSFDLPEDLDLSTGDEDESLIPLDPTVEAPDLDEVPPMDETDAVVLDFDTSESGEEDDESEIDLEFGAEDVESDSVDEEEPQAEVDESTVAMSSVEKAEAQVEPEGTRHIEAALDMDMSDLESADLSTGNFNVDDDSDITEFKPADMTEEFTTFDPEADADAAEEVDVSAGVDKTGTFAPGDFDDATKDSFAAVDESGEIEDLMLPDDVDEVSTKLDLAKAFIDMGDAEGAKSSLEEVLSEGTQEQKAEATGLLNKIN